MAWPMTAGGSSVLPLTRIFRTSNFIGAGELVLAGTTMFSADNSPSATSTMTMPLVNACSGSDTRT